MYRRLTYCTNITKIPMIKKKMYYTNNNELKCVKVYFLGILIYQKYIKFNEPTFS